MTTRTAFPAWLRDHLIDTGALTAAGLSRRAKPLLHAPCRTLTIAGFDNDTCAFDAWTDPAPITPEGEIHALLDQRRTYDLDGDRLYARDRWTIPGRPPAPHRVVLSEHRCHHPIPATWHAPLAPPPTTRPDGLPF